MEPQRLLANLLLASACTLLAHCTQIVSCASAQTVVFCGRDVVVVGSLEATEQRLDVSIRWQWDAKTCEQIPTSYRAAFATTDECKPMANGESLLITSSSGGCAVVEYPSGKAKWYARVPNAHSIERLPGNRVVVASSVAPQGNKLVLFDLDRPDQPQSEVPLKSAHGVVWDELRQLLWAIGYDELQSYRLQETSAGSPATLLLNKRYPLPTNGGHDLIAVKGGDDLLLSTEAGVYWFNRGSEQFRPHTALGDRLHIKSLALHPITHRLAVIQSSEEKWWSNQIELLSPSQTVRVNGQDLYKLRWMPSH